jgi:hypothetical protein
MRVALVVPVALPCTPRGVWQGAAVAWGRPARSRTGPPAGHTSYTSATRPVGSGMRERCFNIRHSPFRRLAVRRFHLPYRGIRDCDFNLGDRGFRDFRGRVVSRPRPFNDG